MKAILYNNEIIDITQVGTSTHLFDIKDVEIIQDNPDYWTRLEHQYAGMAMQGIITNPIGFENIRARANGNLADEVAQLATEYAHALVEKLKKEEEK